MNNTRLFRSLSDSPDPQKEIEEAEREAQKAAFFANDGKIKVLPPQTFEKDAAENQKFTAIIYGKARNGSRLA